MRNPTLTLALCGFVALGLGWTSVQAPTKSEAAEVAQQNHERYAEQQKVEAQLFFQLLASLLQSYYP